MTGGTTPDEVEAQVRRWADTVRRPRSEVAYTELVYRPMLELFDYLAHGCGVSAVRQARTLTARAMTSPRMTRETMDWRVMTLLAQGASGMTSVGLNAVELVNPR